VPPQRKLQIRRDHQNLLSCHTASPAHNESESATARPGNEGNIFLKITKLVTGSTKWENSCFIKHFFGKGIQIQHHKRLSTSRLLREHRANYLIKPNLAKGRGSEVQGGSENSEKESWRDHKLCSQKYTGKCRRYGMAEPILQERERGENLGRLGTTLGTESANKPSISTGYSEV